MWSCCCRALSSAWSMLKLAGFWRGGTAERRSDEAVLAKLGHGQLRELLRHVLGRARVDALGGRGEHRRSVTGGPEEPRVDHHRGGALEIPRRIRHRPGPARVPVVAPIG